MLYLQMLEFTSLININFQLMNVINILELWTYKATNKYQYRYAPKKYKIYSGLANPLAYIHSSGPHGWTLLH